MRLYECFGDNGFHTTLITTFGIDFGGCGAAAAITTS
jgi:hypothetical protein